MAFAKPEYSRSDVSKAGDIIAKRGGPYGALQTVWAEDVLTNWRASHAYPINTFQATLRDKLERIDREAIVAQRLKRRPSIVAKLQRFKTMELARMQDIGGLRAVVSSISRVRALNAAYGKARFAHELHNSKNYIDNPKADGYRGIHLIYRYKNPNAPDYDGLSIELQLRTKIQHAWATAVETMGTFLGQALKSGLGEAEWRAFFSNASAAMALREKTAPIPGYEGMTTDEVYARLAKAEHKLRVTEKLAAFAVAAEHIAFGKGRFHLIVLNTEKRTLSVNPFPEARLDEANKEYAAVEQRTKNGEPIEAVLVSAGPIEALRKAYPNYWLDTQEFTNEVHKVMALVGSPARPPNPRASRRARKK